MSATQHPVFTIGHSTHSAEAFLALLRLHGVGAVADVRSAPFSRFNPQFNRDALEQLLKRKAPKLVAVALANKMARIAWKLMATGQSYLGKSSPVTMAKAA